MSVDNYEHSTDNVYAVITLYQNGIYSTTMTFYILKSE